MSYAYAIDLDTDDLKWRRRTAIEMIVSGIIGLTASLVLSIEAWQLASDANRTFVCDISSTVSCTQVATTWQAQLLGFPNAFLGVLFESVVLAVSVALWAGVRFPRWYLLCVQALYTIALAFAYWLFSQSYFVIHALCPWCLTITFTTTLVFAGLLRINMYEGVIPVSDSVRRFIRGGLDWAITGLVLFIIAAMLVAGYGPDFLRSL